MMCHSISTRITLLPFAHCHNFCNETCNWEADIFLSTLTVQYSWAMLRGPGDGPGRGKNSYNDTEYAY